jgi:hypothetical protein
MTWKPNWSEKAKLADWIVFGISVVVLLGMSLVIFNPNIATYVVYNPSGSAGGIDPTQQGTCFSDPAAIEAAGLEYSPEFETDLLSCYGAAAWTEFCPSGAGQGDSSCISRSDIPSDFAEFAEQYQEASRESGGGSGKAAPTWMDDGGPLQLGSGGQEGGGGPGSCLRSGPGYSAQYSGTGGGNQGDCISGGGTWVYEGEPDRVGSAEYLAQLDCFKDRTKCDNAADPRSQEEAEAQIDQFKDDFLRALCERTPGCDVNDPNYKLFLQEQGLLSDPEIVDGYRTALGICAVLNVDTELCNPSNLFSQCQGLSGSQFGDCVKNNQKDFTLDVCSQVPNYPGCETAKCFYDTTGDCNPAEKRAADQIVDKCNELGLGSQKSEIFCEQPGFSDVYFDTCTNEDNFSDPACANFDKWYNDCIENVGSQDYCTEGAIADAAQDSIDGYCTQFPGACASSDEALNIPGVQRVSCVTPGGQPAEINNSRRAAQSCIDSGGTVCVLTPGQAIATNCQSNLAGLEQPYNETPAEQGPTQPPVPNFTNEQAAYFFGCIAQNPLNYAICLAQAMVLQPTKPGVPPTEATAAASPDKREGIFKETTRKLKEWRTCIKEGHKAGKKYFGSDLWTSCASTWGADYDGLNPDDLAQVLGGYFENIPPDAVITCDGEEHVGDVRGMLDCFQENETVCMTIGGKEYCAEDPQELVVKTYDYIGDPKSMLRQYTAQQIAAVQQCAVSNPFTIGVCLVQSGYFEAQSEIDNIAKFLTPEQFQQYQAKLFTSQTNWTKCLFGGLFGGTKAGNKSLWSGCGSQNLGSGAGGINPEILIGMLGPVTEFFPDNITMTCDGRFVTNGARGITDCFQQGEKICMTIDGKNQCADDPLSLAELGIENFGLPEEPPAPTEGIDPATMQVLGDVFRCMMGDPATANLCSVAATANADGEIADSPEFNDQMAAYARCMVESPSFLAICLANSGLFNTPAEIPAEELPAEPVVKPSDGLVFGTEPPADLGRITCATASAFQIDVSLGEIGTGCLDLSGTVDDLERKLIFRDKDGNILLETNNVTEINNLLRFLGSADLNPDYLNDLKDLPEAIDEAAQSDPSQIEPEPDVAVRLAWQYTYTSIDSKGKVSTVVATLFANSIQELNKKMADEDIRNKLGYTYIKSGIFLNRPSGAQPPEFYQERFYQGTAARSEELSQLATLTLRFSAAKIKYNQKR